MFPFLNNNGYPIPPYPYNFNLESYRSSQFQISPYVYPFMNPNFPAHHENTLLNGLPPQQMPYFYQRGPTFIQEQNAGEKNKKRMTKKLALTEIKKKIRASNVEYKSKRGTFKYFDPSRAPPITSLRNTQQIESDVLHLKRRHEFYNSYEDQPDQRVQQSQLRLQVLLEQPDPVNYPFLICKKRKYHRHQKRRYSVAYFEQRSVYIINKQPIPASLHPKNKVRKPRVPKNSVSQVSDSSENYSSSYSSQSYEKINSEMKRSKKDGKVFIKVEKQEALQNNRIKQEIESSPLSEAQR